MLEEECPLQKLFSEYETIDHEKVGLSVCDNPFCQCTALYMDFELDEIDGRLEFDVLERKLKKNSMKSSVYKQLLLPFVKNLNDHHWSILARTHAALKYEATRNYDADEYKPVDFDFDGVDEGMMVTYNELFMWDRKLSFQIDDVEYLVNDQYCINPSCSCRDAHIQFIAFIVNEETLDISLLEDDEMLYVSHNYKTGKWKRKEYEFQIKHSEKQILRKLKESYPDISSIFKSRHNKLKSVYSSLQENEKQQLVAQEESSNVKVGRNEPCPCGSGKKYKKCCWKKN